MNKLFSSFFFLLGALPVVLAVALVSACGTSVAEEQTLVYARAGDSVGLDPAREADSESVLVLSEIVEQLVQFKPETTDIEPGLAESWTISPDGLTYTFALRKGVRFHDGTPFNAEAVALNYERQRNPEHPYYQYGPYKYWGFVNLSAIVASIEATDEYTVTFTLRKPNAPFLATLGMPPLGIISPAELQKYPTSGSIAPVGTGPFKFVSWVKGDAITLERNEDYWGEKAKLDRVIFKVIPEPTARAFALEKGEIDIFRGLSPEDMERVQNNPDIFLYEAAGSNISYLALNTQKKPFDDVRVRRAVSHALNKQEIVAAVYGDAAVPADAPIPPVLWSYNKDIVQYEYNPEKAKALLAEAGYPDGFAFTLWPNYRAGGARAAEIVQAQLAAVGITASIEQLDAAALLDGTGNGRHQAAFSGWSGGNGDPDNFLATLLSAHTASPPASNIAFWKNEEFTKLTDRAAAITNREERAALYRKAQEIFADQAPWVTIAYAKRIVPMRRYVKGFRGTPVAGELSNLRLVYMQK